MDNAYFKQKLLVEKENLEKEIKSYQAKDPYLGERSSENYDDDISEMEGHDRNIGTVNELERDLGEVNAALERIENGTYGKCENCSQDINKERLDLVPTARFCTNCENSK